MNCYRRASTGLRMSAQAFQQCSRCRLAGSTVTPHVWYQQAKQLSAQHAHLRWPLAALTACGRWHRCPVAVPRSLPCSSSPPNAARCCDARCPGQAGWLHCTQALQHTAHDYRHATNRRQLVGIERWGVAGHGWNQRSTANPCSMTGNGAQDLACASVCRCAAIKLSVRSGKNQVRQLRRRCCCKRSTKPGQHSHSPADAGQHQG